MDSPQQQEMFSFVPARCDGAPFARPVIELSGYVNSRLDMAAKYTVATARQAQATWRDVAGQVRAQGLDLAVFLAEPDVVTGHAEVEESTSAGCSDRLQRHDRQRHLYQ